MSDPEIKANIITSVDVAVALEVSPTVYISGPMTGVPLHNKPLFDEAAAKLRALGFTVLNPHDIAPADGRSWEDAMRADIIAMLHPDCKAIGLLPDWEKSRGAKLEVGVAAALAYTMLHYVDGEWR